MDEDGYDEIISFLWKRGTYGILHPFWKNNDWYRYSQYVYIYTLRERKSYFSGSPRPSGFMLPLSDKRIWGLHPKSERQKAAVNNYTAAESSI